MNAGAYNGEIKDNIDTVTVITRNGNIKIYTKNEILFGYRKSIFQNKE